MSAPWPLDPRPSHKRWRHAGGRLLSGLHPERVLDEATSVGAGARPFLPDHHAGTWKTVILTYGGSKDILDHDQQRYLNLYCYWFGER